MCGSETTPLDMLYEFTEYLTQFETGILKVQLEDWYLDARKLWRSEVHSIRHHVKDCTRFRQAVEMSAQMEHHPSLCKYALKINDQSTSSAMEWCLDNDEVIRDNITLSGLDDETPVYPLRGNYDTSFGDMCFGVRGPWSGRTMTALAGAAEDTLLSGFVWKSPTGSYVFKGCARSLSDMSQNAVALTFNYGCTTFSGKIWNSGVKTTWEGRLDLCPFKRLSGAGWCGLRNMGNTCYQNSLLQV